MLLKNIKGVILASGEPESLSGIPGVEVTTPEGADPVATVVDEPAFEAYLLEANASYNSKLKNATDLEIAELKEHQKELFEMAEQSGFVPVYDAENNKIDFVKPDDTGHLEYVPVKNAEGVVTHFTVVPLEHSAPEVYPVYDFRNNIVDHVTAEEAEQNSNLKHDTIEGKTIYRKNPVFIFTCSPVIGNVRVEGAVDQADAEKLLGAKTLSEFISRDNTKLAFVE